MKKNNYLILIAIFIFAYFLRTMYLPQKALTFGYDQARDAVHATQISRGDVKILGPSSSTPGLYHGVFYYYVLAPAYLIGDGNPITAAYWIAFLSTLTVITVFFIAYSLTKKPLAGFLSSFIFAVSFESSQYATWLSNPTIAITTIPLMYLFLWQYIKTAKTKFAIATGIFFGLSVQAEIFLLYHAPIIAFWIYISRKKLKIKSLIYLCTSFLLSTSTMIVSEIKFGFKGIAGIKSLLNSNPALFGGDGLGDYLSLFLNQVGRIFAFSIYPSNIMISSIFVFGIIIFFLTKISQIKKTDDPKWELFLITWMFSHISIVSMGGVSTPFLLVGIAPAVCILIGIWLSIISKNNLVVTLSLLLIISYANISMITKQNINGQNIFAIQKDMLLSKQLAAVDYTYQNSSEDFSVNSVTSPFWVNIVWAYLYDWYGVDNYGYKPVFHGRDQVGQVIALEQTEIKNTSFLILEPPAGIPLQLYNSAIQNENDISKVTEEKNFGELIIQKREKYE